MTMKEPCVEVQGNREGKCHSPAAEASLDLLALAGAVLLRSAVSYQRGLRTVCANQHVTLSLLILL